MYSSHGSNIGPVGIAGIGLNGGNGGNGASGMDASHQPNSSTTLALQSPYAPETTLSATWAAFDDHEEQFVHAVDDVLAVVEDEQYFLAA